MVDRARRVQPARYVAGLLLWQGVAWLAATAIGLAIWIATLPVGAGAVSHGTAVLWRMAQLLAIAIGASLGAAEVGMACRLRRGPRLLLALAVGIQGATLAAALVVAAVVVIIAGSLLELLALSGAFLTEAMGPAAHSITMQRMVTVRPA